MTILLISLVWLAVLAALVYRLATRPERDAADWERSPGLLDGNRSSFEDAIATLLQSQPATAKDMRDSAQKDLYVRP